MKLAILMICFLLASALAVYPTQQKPWGRLKSTELVSYVSPQDGEQGSCYQDGHEVRCSDGRYHAPDGSVQPDLCSNYEKDTHPCECLRATVCPKDGGPNRGMTPGPKCQTHCRNDACGCVMLSCS